MTGLDIGSEIPSSVRRPRIFLLGAHPSLSDGQLHSDSQLVADLDSATKLRLTGQNSGNQVIAYGLLNAVEFETVSWDASIGPDRVNSEYDVILIAAANFLHTGFDFSGMASFLEATKLPCTMIGVGAQSKDYSTDIPLMPGTERLMRIVAERSAIIGARGPFTASVLEKMGIHNVQVTGCPSYYMGAKPSLTVHKPPLSNNSRLLINSSRDVVSHSFDREHMISIVCELVSLAIERQADFVAQSELPEIEIADSLDHGKMDFKVREILSTFPAYNTVASPDELMSWFKQHVQVYWDVGLWFKAMKDYNFVIGNRFHGCMIALQAGTPACVICHDTRTSEMCEFFGLPFIGLKEIKAVNVDELYALVDPLAIQARYTQLYPQYKQFLRLNGIHSKLE